MQVRPYRSRSAADLNSYQAGNATGIIADLTICIGNVRSVAHQASSFGDLTGAQWHCNRMAGRQICQLHPTNGKQPVPTGEKRVVAIACKNCEGRVDLPTSAGIQHVDLHSHDASCRLHVSQRGTPGSTGLAGLTSNHTRTALGISSRKSSFSPASIAMALN